MRISGPTSRWRLDGQGNLYHADGYVGIGTDTPIGLLTLDTAVINVDDSGRLVFSDSTGTLTFETLLSITGLDGYATVTDLQGLAGTELEHTLQTSDALVTIRKDLDGYQLQISGLSQTESEHYDQLGKAIQTVISSLDGYSADTGLALTVQEHYTQHSQAIQTILKELDGYGSVSDLQGLVNTELEHTLQSSDIFETIRKDLDGYALVSTENQRWTDSSQQLQDIRIALDGYTGADPGLSQTVQEHYTQHGEAIQIIRKDLDGYASLATEDQRWIDASQQRQDIRDALDGYGSVTDLQGLVNTELEHTLQSSDIFETIRKDLDGYALLAVEDQRWIDASQQLQALRDAADGYTGADPGLTQTVQEHYVQHSEAIQTIIKDLDGYALSDLEDQRWIDSSQQRQEIRNALDGYGSVTDLQGLVNTELEHTLQSSEVFETIRKDLDGYALLSIENQRWIDSSEQLQALRDAADAYGTGALEAQHWIDSSQQRQDIRDALDGYALDSDLTGLDGTVSEHYRQLGGAVKAITDVIDGYSAPPGGVLNVTFEENKAYWNDALSTIVKDLDGYALLDIENQRWADASQQLQDLRDAADGYTGADPGLTQTVQEHYNQHSEAINIIRKDLDGYALVTDLAGQVATEAEHYLQHSDTIQTILKDLDGYALDSDLSGLDSTVQSHKVTFNGDIKAIIDVLDGYDDTAEIAGLTATVEEHKLETYALQKAITDVIDGYALDSDLSGLDATVQEHKVAFSGNIKAIIDVLDGYDDSSLVTGLDTTVSEHYAQHSAAIQTILKDLDGYALAADLAGLAVTVDEHKTSVSGDIKAIIDVLDGYNDSAAIAGLDSTVSEHYRQHSDALQSVLKDLDGYSTLTTAQGADGYIAFFTDSNSLAGDNDLFYDRVNSRLGVGTTTPLRKLHVAQGSIYVDNGRVGIGVDNPQYELDVAGDAHITGRLYVDILEVDGYLISNTVENHVDGYLNPVADDAYGLGTEDLRWKDIFLGPGSLHIRTNANETDVGDLRDWNLGVTAEGSLRIRQAADNHILFTDAGLMQFGGASASFPSIKRVNSTIQFRLADDSDYARIDAGNIYANGDMRVPQGNTIYWTSRTKMDSPADGSLLLYNAAENDFSLLQLGGTTNAYPALKRSAAVLHIRKADDSDYADLVAENITSGGLIASSSHVRAAVSSAHNWNSRSAMFSDADGDIRFTDSSATFFNLLQLGGLTDEYPAIKRAGRNIEIRTANDGDYTSLTVASLDAYGDVTGTRILASKGTVSAPGIAWADNTNTGIYSNSNDYLIFTIGGAQKASIYSTGVRANNYIVEASGYLSWVSSSRLYSSSDGVIRLTNNAGTGFSLLQFGGTNTSYPALKRVSNYLHVRLADDSNYAGLVAYSLDSATTVTAESIEVASDISIGGDILNNSLTEAFETIRTTLDGYGNVTTTSEYTDGYIAFFTSPGAIAGDNDLYFDRDSHNFLIGGGGKLGVGITTPLNPLHVRGAVDAGAPTGFLEGLFATSDGQQEILGIRARSTISSINDGFGPIIAYRVADTSGVASLGSSGMIRDGADDSGAFVWNTALSGSTSEKMRLDSSGNLSIYKDISIGGDILNKTLTETFETISSALDGYSTLSITNAADNRIAIFTGVNSVEGDTNFTWSGSILSMLGNTIISQVGNFVDSVIFLRSNAGKNRILRFDTSSSARWYLKVNDTSESGSNVGSDFEIQRFDDSGIYLGSPFQIERSSGIIDVGNSLNVAGSLSVGGALNNADLSQFLQTIVKALDGYGVAGQSESNSEAIQTILKDLDGYAQTEQEHHFQISEAIQTIRKDLDGYVTSTNVDGYTPGAISFFIDNTVLAGDTNLFWDQETSTLQTGNVDVFGDFYVAGAINNDDLSETIQVITQALDGYGGGITAAQGADGYIAFFINNSTIAGDNDLYWNRETNRLELNNLTVNSQIATSSGTILTDGGADGNIILSNAAGTQGIKFDTSVDGTVTLTDESGGALNIATSGQVQGGSLYSSGPIVMANPQKFYLDNGSNTYIWQPAADEMVFVVGAATMLTLDDDGPNLLGTQSATSHGLSTGDVVLGGSLEVDGYTWMDGGFGVDGDSGITGRLDVQQIRLPTVNEPTNPALSFGDKDTGIYQAGDNQLNVAVDGEHHWRFSKVSFHGAGNNGGALQDEAPSATNPTVLPNIADTDSGIGQNAADQLSLIAGGIEAIRISEATNITVDVNGDLNIGGALNNADLSETLQVIRQALDGYSGGGGITATEGADGYIAFFTGADSIAGDNDLFYNRETSELTLNGSLTVNTGNLDVSQRILVGDGTQSAPSIAFASEDDGSGTGLYRPSAGQISIVTNGNKMITCWDTHYTISWLDFNINGKTLIDLSRPVTLGTNTTTSHGLTYGNVIVGADFEVDGYTWLDGGLSVQGGFSAGGDLSIGGTLTAQGKLGIGTTDPSPYGAHIVGSMRVVGGGDAGTAGIIGITNVAGNHWTIGTGLSGGDKLEVWEGLGGGTFVAAFDTGGNLGLGIASPDNELHVWRASAGSVSSDSNALLTLENNTQAALQFLVPANARSDIYFGDVNNNNIGRISYDHFSEWMDFWVEGSSAIRIDGSVSPKLIGIGITNPSYHLDLQRSTAGDLTLNVENTDTTSTSDAIVRVATNGTGGDPLVHLLAGGTQYYVGVDNSVNQFMIGSGSAVGTTPAITIDGSQNTYINGNLIAKSSILGDSASGNVVFAGGNAFNNGANMWLYGGSAGAQANEIDINATVHKLRSQNGGTTFLQVDLDGVNVIGDLIVGGAIENHTLQTALDGYSGGGGVSATEGADGYIAFFTGSDSIAGDNDLFFDRVNNRLGVGTSSPDQKVHVEGKMLIVAPGYNDYSPPSLAFGDGDSGFYETSDDWLAVAVGGNYHSRWRSGRYESLTNASFALWTTAATATTPTFSPANNDSDTGIGSAASDQLSIIAGGVEVARAVENTYDQFVISPDGVQNAAATPSLAFGDGDTGFYEHIDDTISISCIGTRSFYINAAQISGNSSNSGTIMNESASSTNPTLIPSSGNYNAGIGSAGANILSLITNSTERIRITDTGRVGIGTDSPDTLLHVAGDGYFDGYLMPFTDDTWGLGTPDKRWRDLYLGPTSLHIVSKDTDGGRPNKIFTWNVTEGGKLQLTDNESIVAEFDSGTGASFPAGGGGSGGVTSTQGADGYLAFFTGPDAIAGDNDLFYNRETGALTLNSDIVMGEYLRFGGTTNSYPMLVRSGNSLLLRNAENSGYVGLTVNTIFAYGYTAHSGVSYRWDTRSQMFSTANGNISLTDSAGTSFGLLQFGGTTSSYPALKRNSNMLEVVSADDGGNRSLKVYDLYATSSVAPDAGASMRWTGRTRMYSPADGDIYLTNNSSSFFNMLMLGGTTNAFPALKRVDNKIHFRFADDTDYASIACETLDAYGDIQVQNGNLFVSNGNITSGRVLVGDGSLSAPSFSFSGSTSTGMFLSFGDLRFVRSGTSKMSFSSSQTAFVNTSTLDLGNARLLNSYGLINIGSAASTSHSLGANDVIFGEDIEVDGYAWLDGGFGANGDSGITGTLSVEKLRLPAAGSAVNPALAFGDGSAGLYSGGVNILRIASAGEDRWQLTYNDIQAWDNSGLALVNEAASSTNPVYVFRFDYDTGIGHAAADQVSIIAGGVEVARAVENTYDQFIISPDGVQNDSSHPSLAFGDANTGFYESVDNTLVVSTLGTSRYEWNGDWYKGTTTGGPGWRNIDSTDTQPNMFPDNNDTNTGIGAAGADQLSLIAGGIETARFTTNGVGIGTGTPSALLHVAGDGYFDGYLMPYTDNQWGLGTPDKRWRDLYLGPTSLHIVSKDTDDGRPNRTFTWAVSETGELQLMDEETVVASFDANNGASFPSGGGGAEPAGADTQIQFNDNGSFGGSANLTWATNTLSVNGNIATTAATGWTLLDNQTAALSFNSTGHTGLLVLDTTDSGERVRVGSSANSSRMLNTRLVASYSSTGLNWSSQTGIFGEAVSDGTASAYGVVGYGQANGSWNGAGVAGHGRVSSTDDTGVSYGGYFTSNQTHAGGNNIAIYVSALGSSTANNAIYISSGDIQTGNPLDWDLAGYNSSSLSFDCTTKAGILNFDTSAGAEGVSFSGYVGLSTTSNLLWTGRTKLISASDGTLDILNNAASQGVRLDTTTANQLIVKNQAGSAASVLAGAGFYVTSTSFFTGGILQLNNSSAAVWNTYNGGSLSIYTDTYGSAATGGLSLYTGANTGPGWASGPVKIYTGATTTNGFVGDLILYAGLAASGVGYAGDIIFGVQGDPTSSGIQILKLKGSDGLVYMGTSSQGIKFNTNVDGQLTLTDESAGAITLVAGTFKAGDGSAAAPSIRTSTYAHGIYSYSANNLGLAAAGAEVANLSTSMMALPGIIQVGSGAKLQWPSSTKIAAPSNGTLTIFNSLETQGIKFDVTTDGTLILTDESDAAAAITIGGTLSTGDIKMTALKKLYLDGGGDTYFTEIGADIVQLYVGGSVAMSFTEDATDTVSFGSGWVVSMASSLSVAGQITLKDGTVGSPATRFLSANHGFFLTNGGASIGVSVSGQTVATFDTERFMGSVGIESSAAQYLGWYSRVHMTSPADGKMIIGNFAEDQGILFDTTTDGKLTLTDESSGVAILAVDKVLHGDGSLSAPSMAFANETGTGWFRSGASSPYFVVNGTSRLAFSASQTGFPNTTLVTMTRLSNTSGVFVIGNSASTSHGMGANDLLIGSDFEVDGYTFLDSAIVLNRTATATDIYVDATQGIVAVTDTSSPRTVFLTDAAELGSGHTLFIKDESGNAGSNNITVQPADAGQTIDGTASVTINTNYGSIQVYTDGSNWFTL